MHDQHIWPSASYWSYLHIDADPCNHNLKMYHLEPIPGSHAAVSYAACLTSFFTSTRIDRGFEKTIAACHCSLIEADEMRGANHQVNIRICTSGEGCTCVTRAEPHLRSKYVQVEIMYARLAFPPIHHAKRPRYPMIMNNISHPTQHYSQRDAQTLCPPVSVPGRVPSLPAGPVHP